MMRGNGFHTLFMSVMAEAVKKFGRVDAANQAEVGQWVHTRIHEIRTGQAPLPEPPDLKERAAGGDA